MLHALFTILSFQAPLPPQDPARAEWTQAELEKVSAEIAVEVEDLRGEKFQKPVAVQLTDQAGFLEYARKRQAATESPERRLRDETAAKLLGLIPRDLDLQKTFEAFLEQQVGGFYDPGSRTFYLMKTFRGDLARIILAHELTHALDDQLFDLDKLIRGAGQDTDAEFAVQAMVEGSGVNAMNAWTMKHLAQLDRKALSESSDLGTKGLDTAPTLVWKPLLAAYLRGDGFLVHAEGLNMLMGKARKEELVACFGAPPRSSEQILHPKKYWDAKKRDDPRRVTLDAAALSKEWQVIGQDTLGELALGLVTQPFAERGGLDAKNALALVNTRYTNATVEGWGGDRLLLARKGEARVLYLATAWDTPQDADEFEAALRELTRPVEAGAAGPEAARGAWLSGLSALEIVRDPKQAVVTLRIEHGTRPGAEGLPAMLPWDVAK